MSQTFAQLINGKSATVEFSTGSASTPSVAFSGDTNTGIYSPGADQVAISTGGSGRLFITNGGNVGVGVSSPQGKLTVSNSGAEGIEFNPGYASGLSSILAYNRTTSAHTELGFEATQFPFRISGTERMRLDSSGRLGVGTSSPGSLLTVKSPGAATTFFNCENSSGTSILRLFQTAGGSGRLIVSDSTGTDFFNVQADQGRVGIGTSSPTEALTVNGRVQCQWNAFANGGTTSYSGDATSLVTGSTAGMWAARSDSALLFSIGSSEKARIDSSGRLGIGTTSPVNKLDVNGSISASGNFSNTGNTPSVHIGLSSGTPAICSGNNVASTYLPLVFTRETTTGSAESMRLDASGRLLVGTSSSTGANVKGVFGAGLASSDGVLVVNTNDQAINAITISNWDGATTTNGAKMTFSNSGIGDFIIGAGSGINRFEVFNGAGTGVFLTSGNTSWTSTSDERLKTDLAPIENAIDRVNSLRAVTGRFKTDEEGVSRGFLIAQDVQLVFPEAVDNSNPDELGVRYTEVIPLLVAALKESKERIEALEAKVAALETA